jgi:hypothetical protein
MEDEEFSKIANDICGRNGNIDMNIENYNLLMNKNSGLSAYNKDFIAEEFAKGDKSSLKIDFDQHGYVKIAKGDGAILFDGCQKTVDIK